MKVRKIVIGRMRRRGVSDIDWQDESLRQPSIEPDVIPVVTADGAKLNVHAYGPENGDPIVLSHGWTCSIEYWYPQINELAGKYRVIAYDQRGHGASTTGKRRFTTDTLADDLADVLAATVSPRKKAVIVGHSMGGISIMAWAGRHGDQVDRLASGLVLLNTGAGELVAETTLIPFIGEAKLIRSVAGRVILGAPVPLPINAPTRAIFKNRVMSSEATREQVEFSQRIVFGCNPTVRARWGLALHATDLRAALVNLNVPTAVVAGENDHLTPPVHSVRLAEALDDAGVLDHYRLLPGVGHLGNVEAATAVNEEIVKMRTAKRRRTARKIAAAG